jgi:glycogen(starch) synthase
VVRVLVTTDTFSGVWTHTRELVSGLVTHGAQVILVSFGEIPLPQQTAWMHSLHGLEYHPTAFRLDWMQEGEQDFYAAQDYLCAVVRDTRPDFLHLNQLSFGAIPVATPRLVVANGDVITWWLTIHGREPAQSDWLEWYRAIMTAGMKRAEAVVTTTRWMEEMLRLAYSDDFSGHVIPPGRNPIYFNPFVTKEDSVLAIGRLWDTGKQVSLLTQHTHGLPVCIVGADATIPAPSLPIRADVKVSTGEHEISVKGAQTEPQLRALYSKSTIFAATSRYEPLGLASVEAAFSRCALVANDTPVYRELWGDAALYFERNNADSLTEVLEQLSQDAELARLYGTRAYNRARERFTARRMVDDYMRLYRQLRTAKVAVA